MPAPGPSPNTDVVLVMASVPIHFAQAAGASMLL
jgi:hypothetical protein